MTDSTHTSDAAQSASPSNTPQTPPAGSKPEPARPRESSTQLLENVKADSDALDRAVEEAMVGVTESDLSAVSSSAPPTDGEGAGTIRAGRIANIGSQDVLIDFGGKSLGAMPRSDFAKGETYKIGDEIEVLIVDGEPRNGLLEVSRRKARQARLMSSLQAGTIMEGVVTGMNKGGLEVD